MKAFYTAPGRIVALVPVEEFLLVIYEKKWPFFKPTLRVEVLKPCSHGHLDWDDCPDCRH